MLMARRSRVGYFTSGTLSGVGSFQKQNLDMGKLYHPAKCNASVNQLLPRHFRAECYFRFQSYCNQNAQGHMQNGRCTSPIPAHVAGVCQCAGRTPSTRHHFSVRITIGCAHDGNLTCRVACTGADANRQATEQGALPFLSDSATELREALKIRLEAQAHGPLNIGSPLTPRIHASSAAALAAPPAAAEAAAATAAALTPASVTASGAATVPATALVAAAMAAATSAATAATAAMAAATAAARAAAEVATALEVATAAGAPKV